MLVHKPKTYRPPEWCQGILTLSLSHWMMPNTDRPLRVEDTS